MTYEAGSIGDKFYIILAGAVSIHVPKAVKVESDAETRCQEMKRQLMVIEEVPDSAK